MENILNEIKEALENVTEINELNDMAFPINNSVKIWSTIK